MTSANWPAWISSLSWLHGTRAICRRDEPYPGAQFTFANVSGYRFHVFITDRDDDDIAYVGERHRGQRVLRSGFGVAMTPGCLTCRSSNSRRTLFGCHWCSRRRTS